MFKMNEYFKNHMTLTLILTWVFLAIALGYALLVLLVYTDWMFWLMLIPALIALYFRVIYAKGYYKKYPERDKYSDQYIPYKERKKQEQQKKNRKK